MHTAAVRYADPEGIEFVVLLGWNGKLQYIKPLEEIIHLIRFKRAWRVPRDRMMWEHPGGKWRILVTVKRNIVLSERILVVNISCEDSGGDLR